MSEFTPKQKDEIDTIGANRDWDKDRDSRFSHGEEESLDDREKVRGHTPFTNEQLSHLKTLAETRDIQRKRKSRFSEGEQQELDDAAVGVANTASIRAEELVDKAEKRAEALADEAVLRASGLGFNERQQKELTHRFRKRWLPVLGYIILTLGMAYAVGTSHSAAIKTALTAKQQAIQHSNENRTQIAANVRLTTLTNCNGGNDLRAILRDILQTSIPQTQQLVKDHTLTQAQANRGIASIKLSQQKLAARDCKELIKQLH